MSDKQTAPILPPLIGGGGNNGGNNGGASQQQTVSLQQVLATAQGINVLTASSGQQFVITSQVPGITQVIPSSGATNSSVQQVGVTRIVNITNTPPRVNAVAVGGTSSSPLTSPSRQNPTKVVLATSPKLVRTSIGNMFVAPSSHASVQSPPARKRLKLSESTESKATATTVDDAMGYRRRIMEHKMKRMRAIREKYAENASELFFLHAGGNMMDFQTWRKRPPTPQYLHFLRQNRLDPDDDDEDLTVPLPSITELPVTPTVTSTVSTVVPLSQSMEVKISGVGGTPVAVSTTLPAAVAQLSQQGGTPIVPDVSKPVATTTTTITTTTTTIAAANPVAEKLSVTTAVAVSTKSPVPSLTTSQPIVKLVKLPASTVASSCDITNNQEQIVEKAKQEAYVMQRIAELQREGLWSERRLPKVQEPARTKAHWDYLLEEMVWLAADFAQERKWKKAAAKKCARMVQKHFQEKAIQAQKAEKSQELRLKKIASFVAKEIKTFWTNVEKLVEYKQQTRLEEKRKKALDQHLNFIVGQTEKYSTWLTEGLNKTEGPQSIPASINSSRISSPIPVGKSHSDEEFQPNQSSDDDEETIAKAEEEIKLNHKEEVELLKKESEIPLEDLLKDLPPNYLEDRDKSLSPELKEEVEVENERTTDGDDDFVAASDESSDEEDTIMEQEKLEGDADHKQELDDLKAENEMSIDELMAKYGNLSNVPMDVDEQNDEESGKESDKEDNENEEQVTSSESENEESDDEVDEEDSQAQTDTETDVGLKSLLEDISIEKSSDEKNIEAEHSDAHNEMDNVAALAESIQPKGNTLLTTSVVTKIPFLLKHSLREYQHIGLDWLVTMYDRKLNGILADEMGLGKTIQTIALLAHLACEKGNWGPHLIIVPTSVMLNWEMECKKWCPGFKILTYYGTQKERKQKRTGWTKPNAFHICITSYKLVIQDHQSFRRKKWKYLILDEAQNIKNFKSQRWQLLLNFQTQRRLLLTGTPLQNNLMELWSLMHFLMPNVFQSHREFKEWFSNPVTGMIEGNSEYNENIIRRLHKVLRPFLLRRLKTEVEKQLPKKYEHVIMCRLSKRQRYLYDDFMSRAKTKETLASGNLLSVINVLMQLRKVCNHPNLFEVRPTVSPFQMEAIEFVTASLVWSALDYDPFKHIDLSSLNLLLLNLEFTLTAFVAHRVRHVQTPRKLIEEIDSQPEPPPRCPSGKIKINVRLSNQVKPPTTQQQTQTKLKNLAGILPTPRVGTSPLIKTLNNQSSSGQGVTLKVAGGQQLQGYSVQLVQHQGGVKAIPVGTLAHNPQSTTVTSSTAAINAQRITVGNANIRDGLQRLATQTVTVKQGDSVQRITVPSFAQLVQTSTGRHIILTSNQQNTNTVSFPVMTSTGQRLTVLSKPLMGLTTTAAATVNKVVGGVVTTTSGTSGRPVMRVPPLNVTASQAHTTSGNGQQSQPQTVRCGIVTRHAQKESEKLQTKEQPKSEFHLPQLEEERRQRRQNKLKLIANVNERRCAACPLYGEDLFIALRIGKPATACQWHSGWVQCAQANGNVRTRKQFFSRTEALAEAIKSTEQIVEELKEIFERFVVYVPAVRAPVPRFHVSHPPPHKLWSHQRMQLDLQRDLSTKLTLFHPVTSAMSTQFPDPRLIQYDCGKLQSLDLLLRKLKSENHRVLIFTQMTRMLDVLEAFLNFHGHIYLRLDGTTRVDQRQVLMERFNGDKRIFCFILSTRSGGVGVNLTGADTVIFYDSDWNPTMDAQAQDRCHRIGQTRDVHIYRLVSEKTVEENILKKANQKRLLGDLAIEGGNFTTAYFKSSTIQDLFNIDQTENDASARMAEVLEQSKERERSQQRDSSVSQTSSAQSQHVEDKVAMGALESALAAAEEDLDVQAAKTAKAEAVADLAEFDENIPLDEADKEDTVVSKAEQEVQNLVSQLTPIERYAMKFIEESEGAFSAAQLAAAERELEEQKKEWELDRLRALREEEERRMRLADDDEKPLTFGREDAQNQVNSASNSKKLVSKKLPPSRRSARRRNSRNVRKSSESETETTTESESESQEDVVEDSLDEESSHTESQSQGDEDEEEEEGDTQNDKSGYSKRKNRSDRSSSQNHFDLNSPRTRSRGNVKINLWTLDVSPILPGIKAKCRGKASQRYKRDNSKNEEKVTLQLPRSSSPRNDTTEKNKGTIDETNKSNEERTLGGQGITLESKSETGNIGNFLHKETIDHPGNSMSVSSQEQDSRRSTFESKKVCVVSLNKESVEVLGNSQKDSNVETTRANLLGDECVQIDISESMLESAIQKSSQTNKAVRCLESVSDTNLNDKIVNDVLSQKSISTTTTVCSVHVTRSMHKSSLNVFNNTINHVIFNEDTENFDVNVTSSCKSHSPMTISKSNDSNALQVSSYVNGKRKIIIDTQSDVEQSKLTILENSQENDKKSGYSVISKSSTLLSTAKEKNGKTKSQTQTPALRSKIAKNKNFDSTISSSTVTTTVDCSNINLNAIVKLVKYEEKSCGSSQKSNETNVLSEMQRKSEKTSDNSKKVTDNEPERVISVIQTYSSQKDQKVDRDNDTNRCSEDDNEEENKNSPKDNSLLTKKSEKNIEGNSNEESKSKVKHDALMPGVATRRAKTNVTAVSSMTKNDKAANDHETSENALKLDALQCSIEKRNLQRGSERIDTSTDTEQIIESSINSVDDKHKLEEIRTTESKQESEEIKTEKKLESSIIQKKEEGRITRSNLRSSCTPSPTNILPSSLKTIEITNEKKNLELNSEEIDDTKTSSNEINREKFNEVHTPNNDDKEVKRCGHSQTIENAKITKPNPKDSMTESQQNSKSPNTSKDKTECVKNCTITLVKDQEKISRSNSDESGTDSKENSAISSDTSKSKIKGSSDVLSANERMRARRSNAGDTSKRKIVGQTKESDISDSTIDEKKPTRLNLTEPVESNEISGNCEISDTHSNSQIKIAIKAEQIKKPETPSPLEQAKITRPPNPSENESDFNAYSDSLTHLNSLSKSNKSSSMKKTEISNLSESARVTRSNAGRSLTPPLPIEGSSKSLQKRRTDDASMSERVKSPPRPVTRSLNVNIVKNEEFTSPYEKPTTRSSRSLMDNGFINPVLFRRSRSIPLIQQSSTINSETDKSKFKKLNDGTNEICGNVIDQSRNPSTTIFTNEQISRVTRSGLHVGKSTSSVSVLRGNRQKITKVDSTKPDTSVDPKSSQSILTKDDSANTDTNGNAVSVEPLRKQDENVSGSKNVEEKPQRTAKVVAILTLDTRSNHNIKTSNSTNHVKPSAGVSPDPKHKKNSDSNLETSKSCVVRLSDISESDAASRDLLAANLLSDTASTYTNSQKTNNTSEKIGNKSRNEKTDKVSMQSTVIALVDLDNKQEFDTDSRRTRKKIKRARIGSISKPLTSGKSSEDKTTDVEDVDEQIPSKKSVRSSQPPSHPPPTQQQTPLEKLRSSSVS